MHTWNMQGQSRAFLNNLIIENVDRGNRACLWWLMDGGDKFDLNYNMYWSASGAVQFRHRTDGAEHTTVGFSNWQNELSAAWGYSYMRGKDAGSKSVDP